MTGRQRRARHLLLVALPAAVVVLSLIVWVVAVSRSGFWADDFLFLTHFNRTLGDLSDDHINTGKYAANVFWAVGTVAFGDGSVVPFLVLNTLVFAGGLILWLRAGTPIHWSGPAAWWIGGAFIATAVWLPTALWSSNVTHSAGFLALGGGALAHQRCLRATTLRDAAAWSLLGGVVWTAAVVSNLLYLGLLVIALHFVRLQAGKLRGLGASRAIVAVLGACNVLLPAVYFAAVGYPATRSNQAYATTGLRYVGENLAYYRTSLAPTGTLLAVYAVIVAAALAGAVLAAGKRDFSGKRDFFALALLGSGVATLIPALVQSQQRDIHYLAMPVLLLFSALATGARPVARGLSRRPTATLVVGLCAGLLLILRQGADVRSFFVTTPFGGALAAFRSQVASLTPPGGVICVKLNLDPPHQALFAAELSGPNGFLVPPINAGQAVLVPVAQACPASASSAQITVALDRQGDFAASG